MSSRSHPRRQRHPLGLTIANGKIGSGGGIYNTGTSTVNVSNCTAQRERGSVGIGGGIAQNGSGGAMNVTNCTFSGNTAAYGVGFSTIAER